MSVPVPKDVSEAYFAKVDAQQLKVDVVVKKYRETSPEAPEYKDAVNELIAANKEMAAIMATSPFKDLPKEGYNLTGPYGNDGGRRRKTRKSKRRGHKTRRHRV